MYETRIAGFPAIATDGRRDRPLVLMLHGAFCTHEVFRPWVRCFAENGYRAVSVARRGRLGVGPINAEGLQFGDYLDDSRQVIEALGEKPVLVGHSLGGLLAQKLAEEGRCAAAVLVAPVPTQSLMAALHTFTPLAPLLPYIIMGKPMARPETCERIALNRVMCPRERQRILEGLVHESGAVFREMMLGRVRVDASKVRCPVRVIAARDDLVIPPRLAQITARRYGAELLMYENNGHWLVGEPGADEIASGIVQWLEGKLQEGALPASQPCGESAADMLVVARTMHSRA
jgi:pimeloyl-ACP methyl ester carboxylesterase